MSSQKISVSVADGVTTIALSDPPANTYSYEMMLEIDGSPGSSGRRARSS